jgi:hypothetical protein
MKEGVLPDGGTAIDSQSRAFILEQLKMKEGVLPDGGTAIDSIESFHTGTIEGRNLQF